MVARIVAPRCGLNAGNSASARTGVQMDLREIPALLAGICLWNLLFAKPGRKD
jgi:hypothetical protein